MLINKRTILIFCLSLFGSFALADGDAPEFDYGFGESHFKWGVQVPITDKESDFKLRLGTRLQTILEDSSMKNTAGQNVHNQDFYIRRARLQVEAKFQENLSYYMDIRADKVDKGNDGGNGFEVGDAFFQAKNVFGSENLKLRLFRAKYDVSRTQTVSSSRLLTPNRVAISDYAAEYISHARRGTNIQLLGNWGNMIKAQVVLGDSIHEGKFQDALGKSTATLNSQNFALGARVRVSPIPGWEEKGLKETYFGKGRHFTLGAGHYRVDNINFDASGVTSEIDRQLNNYEMSFHWGPFALSGEYYLFDGMVDDFSVTNFVEGKSDGWFAQSEFVFTSFHYIAPFVRYQVWDHFKDKADFAETSSVVGINYYIKGNKLRTGMYYDKTTYETAYAAALGLTEDTTKIGAYLMMHY